MHPVIIPSLQVYKKEERIFISCSNNYAAEQIIRRIPGARWSQEKKQWHFEVRREVIDKLKVMFPPEFIIDLTLLKKHLELRKNRIGIQQSLPPRYANLPSLLSIHPVNAGEMKNFLEFLLLKSYSPSTIRTYRIEFFQFLKAAGPIPVKELGSGALKKYMVFCTKQGLSENSLHSRLNALKFYYEQVLKREKFFFDIPRPKKPLLLPNVFSKEEVASIINHVTHLKHKTLLVLIYACGLRVSESVTIRIQDIDSKRMVIHIRGAKGKKDRVVALSANVLVLIRAYYRAFRPRDWLFEGQAPGEHYSVRSVQILLKQAKAKAGIIRPGGVHGLRHSFATHLLDKGIDVMMIQRLLGHNDIRTTLRYLHVTNKDLLKISSPFDDIAGLII